MKQTFICSLSYHFKCEKNLCKDMFYLKLFNDTFDNDTSTWNTDL